MESFIDFVTENASRTSKPVEQIFRLWKILHDLNVRVGYLEPGTCETVYNFNF